MAEGTMSSSARLRIWPAGGNATAWNPAAFDTRPVVAQPSEPAVDPIAEAYALGFAQGRDEGERAERARLGPAVRAADEAIDSINAREERWTGAVEENLVALALGIARHLVDREMNADADVVTGLVGSALATFPVDQPVRIRVNPDDLTIIRTLRAERPASIFGRREEATNWVADARIGRGGCIVEGRDRIVDGRVETALERIYRRISYRDA
jgi:flagellar biosynthesis/type III secretory pathway protein FliH